MTTSRAPVTVTTTSAEASASSRGGVRNPSRCASSVVTGSASTTDTDRERVAEARRDAPPAGAVAEHRHAPAVGDAVGEAQEALEHALADAVAVLGELLDRAVVDHEHRAARSARAAATSRIRPDVVSSVPPSRPSQGRSAKRAKRSPPLSSRSAGRRATTASRNVPWRGRVGRLLADAPRCRARCSQATVAGWVLERLPVATTSAPPRCRVSQHRGGLRLEVDGRAEHEPREGPRALDLVGGRGEQAAAADDPVDAGGGHGATLAARPRSRRAVARARPIRCRRVLLRHHAHLLRQRAPAPGPRVHDHRRRHRVAAHAPAGRGRLLPHGHRRALLRAGQARPPRRASRRRSSSTAARPCSAS